MIKKTFFIGLFALFSTLFLSANAYAEQKIAVVSMQKLFQTAAQLPSLKTAIDKKFGSEKTELEKEQKALQQAADKFKKDRSVMKADEVKKSEQALMQKEQNLQATGMKYRQNVVQYIAKNLDNAIAQVAAKGKYDIVLKKVAIAYVKNGQDITDQVSAVIKKLKFNS